MCFFSSLNVDGNSFLWDISLDFILLSLLCELILKRGTENAKMDFYGFVITKAWSWPLY